MSAMRNEMPAKLAAIAKTQRGIVSRAQALAAGLTNDQIRFRLRSGRWQLVLNGTYATFSGTVSRSAFWWAAVIYAGPGAVLSYETAAAINRMTAQPAEPTDFVHVSVPRQRRVSSVPGVRIHRSARARPIPAVEYPARTSVEDTLLDLACEADSFDDVCAWVTRAFQRRLTNQAMLREMMRRRRKLRWRGELDELIDDAVAGDESVIEFRYTRDVERAHGLPQARRQVRFTGPDGKQGRRDRVYEPYGVIVELDGKSVHAEGKRKDRKRDNAAIADGKHTLRYDYADVRFDTCETAAEVARVLQQYGWTGKPRPCSSACPVGRGSGWPAGASGR
jgi:hypothetical protein